MTIIINFTNIFITYQQYYFLNIWIFFDLVTLIGNNYSYYVLSMKYSL